MSLIYTESFFAFERDNVSDAWDTGVGQGNEAREQMRLSLARAGYGVHVAANTSKDTSGGFIVRNDPVYPQRTALCHSSDVTPGVANQYSAAFRKKLTITDKQIIIGFSMYVPPEYVPNTNTSTVAVFRMNATTQADAAWWEQGIALDSAKEAFRVCNDLSLRWGTDVSQSSKKLTVGAMNYLEVRIDTGTVSVWIDDVFVMQKIVSLIPETVAFCFENNLNSGAGGSQMVGNAGRWAMGNMYYMINDGVGNSARLGPTTRVIAQRPDQDIDVHFIKPAAAPSNAAVAAQDLVDSPPWQLQSTVIGDYDRYTNNDESIKSGIETMALVHAVCTKVLAANLEPDVHTIRPFLMDHSNNTEGADNKPKELVTLQSPTTRAILCMGIRPTDNAIVIAGAGEMCYVSGPNGNTSSWTRISDTGSVITFTAMWIRSDGGVLLGTKSTAGAAQGPRWLAPGATTLLVGTDNVTDPGPTTNGFVMSPDGALLRQFLGPKSQNTLFNESATAAVYNGATPQNGPWNLASVTASGVAPANGGWNAWGSKPDNSMHIGLPAAANNNDNVYQMTAANGATIVSRATGDTGVNYSAVGWDGVAWLIGASTQGGANSAPVIRRSLDGQSWTQVTQIGNTLAGPNQILRGFAANRSNQQSMMFGDGGAIVMSNDGINWRQAPRLTSNALYAGVVTANGDFVIGGDNGALLRLQAQGKDTPLYPLAGYGMAFGSAVFNPATGTTWTPAQAADADFGMKLIS